MISGPSRRRPTTSSPCGDLISVNAFVMVRALAGGVGQVTLFHGDITWPHSRLQQMAASRRCDMAALAANIVTQSNLEPSLDGGHVTAKRV